MLDLEAIAREAREIREAPWAYHADAVRLAQGVIPALLAEVRRLGEYGYRWRSSAEKTGELVVKLEARIAELEAEAATQQRYAREWENRCYQSIVATQEAERQRWFDAISAVAQGCTFEELAVCARIREQIGAAEDPMDGTRATDATGNRL